MLPLNPNAVITGHVGTINLDDVDELGGFAKTGLGILEIHEQSKQFIDNIMLVGGLLKINGNYIMDGKNLVVALVDWDDNGVFDTNTGYGKLEVMGTADISKGYLKVRVDDFVKEIASDSVWHGVVITGTLNGEFVSATDNSPLVDFYANYNDDSRAHL